MIRRFFPKAIYLIGILLLSQTSWAQQTYEEALEAMRKKPKAISNYTPTSMEKLVENATFQLKLRGLKQGDKVVLVTIDNQAFDPVWLDAMRIAIRRMGGLADVITLMPIPRRKGTSLDPMDGRQYVPDSWVPLWVEEAIRQSDVVLFGDYMLYLSYGRGMYWTKQGKRVIASVALPAVPEQLAFDKYAQFPVELDLAIQNKVWEMIGLDKPHRVRLTDPLGTDLTFTFDVDLDWVKKNFPYMNPDSAMAAQGIGLEKHWIFGGAAYQWSHLGMGLEYSKVVDAKGKIVVNAAHMGPLPARMTYIIEQGEVVRIEGGGRVGEDYLKKIRQYDGVEYSVGFGEEKRNKGARWLLTFAIGTTPTIVGPDFFNSNWYREKGNYGLTGGWSDHMRTAGVVHFSVGDVYRGEGLMHGVQPQGASPLKLNGGHLYFPTIEIDGKKLIDNGRLTALDDPEIRKLAARYVSDPKAILDVAEEWRKMIKDEYLNDWPTMRIGERVDYYWEFNEQMDKQLPEPAPHH
ncbi:MAG: hypothetical protein HY645_02680 [Acidobacteria bacterium]|nr:hypothetical protein [Acidobacteriota bacterium]